MHDTHLISLLCRKLIGIVALNTLFGRNIVVVSCKRRPQSPFSATDPAWDAFHRLKEKNGKDTNASLDPALTNAQVRVFG